VLFSNAAAGEEVITVVVLGPTIKNKRTMNNAVILHVVTADAERYAGRCQAENRVTL
jgi:hypothetical protein